MSSAAFPTAIVTGSASGMGKACAERFLREGWRVVALDSQEQKSENPAMHPVEVDIRDEAAVETGVARAIGDDDIGALVHAAGVYPTSNLDDFSESSYRHIFDVNVLGSLNLARLASRRMSQGGAIVFFASVDAFAVSRNQLLYSASKAAVVSITKSLAVELADRKIVVNAVAPGWVDTPGTRAGGRLETGVQSVPLKRAADPSEIAAWAWQLCREPGYVTGEVLCIAGGIIVR